MFKLIKRILVLDVEAEFVHTIIRHLKREGFIVDSAFDVEEARRKIDDSARMMILYDLLITEVVRPNMDAIDLLSWIKKNHPEISVIIVSGFVNNDMLRETMREGLDGYAKLPLTPKKMIDLINIIGQKREKSSENNTKSCGLSIFGCFKVVK
jgi:DNA-binding NtrC family response regulator